MAVVKRMACDACEIHLTDNRQCNQRAGYSYVLAIEFWNFKSKYSCTCANIIVLAEA